MKKISAILLLINIFMYNISFSVYASTSELDYFHMFQENGSVMLLIDLNTGNIEQANKAASEFYGYSVQQLESMKIYDLSTLKQETIKKRMKDSARHFQSNHTENHRLANGDIRTVEIYSCPHTVGKRTLIFVNLFDITEKIELEKRDQFLNTVLDGVLLGVIIIIGLLASILIRNFRKLKKKSWELTVERNKFLQTLMSIGDGVLVVDVEGKISIMNEIAENLTGWSADEAVGKSYKDIFVLSYSDEESSVKDPIENVLYTNSVQESGSHSILTSKEGTKYFIEESAAPIKDDKGLTTGVVLVFRNVTEKEEQRKQIEYLSFHDSLTGLYNRMFFEEELKRLDTDRNLPLSLIVGDMNGLKLANDIFGHAAGDEMLKKLAATFKSECRSEDIIARVGGDEFYILLPKTKEEDAKNIITRIKTRFSKETVNVIRGSISMGCATKTAVNEDISNILREAERRMYAQKALDRSKLKSTAIKMIIDTLHNKYPEEKRHSENVRDICEKIGRKMNLPEVELSRLKEAAFLHDIGKIVLDESLILKNQRLSTQEEYEMNQHPVAGYRILNSFDDTMNLANTVLAHHEKWDGTGYPKGIKGEQIPLKARIINVAEYYDAITNRPWNKPLSKEEIVKELRKQAGKRFDPNIAEVMINVL